MSPEQLVDMAAKAGLKVLAITDHDTLAGLERGIAHGKKVGVEVIPGCELTVYSGSSELHVLSLFLDLEHCSTLRELLSTMQEHRRTRGVRMAQKLSDAGFPLSESDITDAARGAESVGRAHVGEALVRRGHAKNPREAIIKYLLKGGVGYVPKYELTPEVAFESVRNAGGVSILAHPGRTQHDELITPLFRQGLDGIEAYYRSHGEMERRFYAGLARRYEKLVSGGGDFHGPRVTPDIRLGESGVDKQTLYELRRAATERRCRRCLET